MKPLKLLRWGFFSLGLLSAMPNWAQAEALRVSNLVEKALASHPDSALWQAQTLEAKAQQAGAESQIQPKLQLQSELSYAWMQKKDFGRTANQLLATYPLYAPQLEENLTSSDWKSQAQMANTLAEQQTLTLKVIKALLNVRILAAQRVYLQQEKQAIRASLAQVQQRFQVGYQDLNDVVEMQAQADNNQALLLEAQQQQLQVLADLQAWIGEPLTLEQVPKLEETLYFAKDLTEASWPDLIESHPQIKALGFTWQAKQAEVAFAQSQDGPQLQAFGAYVYNDSQQNFYDDMQGLRGGLQLTIPLYLGGKTQAKLDETRAQSQVLLARQQAQMLLLKTTAQKAQLGIQSAQQRLVALKNAILSNQQAVKAAEEGLKTGARNVLEVLQAQSRLYAAQKATATLKAQMQMDQMTLFWALGVLDLERLKITEQ
ncbi:MAG: TolC family protein [Thiotrichales bacterium]|nr:TolC family protein [Thiotrichales bacterium]